MRTVLFLWLLVLTGACCAQNQAPSSAELDAGARAAVIERVLEGLPSDYVFPVLKLDVHAARAPGR